MTNVNPACVELNSFIHAALTKFFSDVDASGYEVTGIADESDTLNRELMNEEEYVASFRVAVVLNRSHLT